MKRWPAVAVLLLALALRLPAVTAGLPYMTYVDEGHVLHHAAYLLEHRTWEPDTYSYPTFPFYLVAGAALAWSPLYAAAHGRPLRADLSPAPFVYYDVVEPTAFLILGRVVTLLSSLGIVVFTGLLARRLAGPRAGWMAAWAAALAPALVMRSSVVNINPMVAFFTTAALYFAEGIRSGGHPRRDALLAGAMAGLAGATKYPAALVCLPVALAVLLAPSPRAEKLRRLLLAGVAAVAVVLIAMPALWLRTAGVLHGLRDMSLVYGTQDEGSYWRQALVRAEWSLPVTQPEVGLAFLLLAAGGVIVGLRDRRASGAVWGWLLFATATGLLVAPYKFRAFRNLLALVPLACVAASLLYVRLRERVGRPAWLDAGFAALLALPFLPALYQYSAYQLALEDSRERAVRRVETVARPGDLVLVSEELAVIPSRLKTLSAETRPWNELKPRITRGMADYVLLADLVQRDGRPRLSGNLRDKVLEDYEILDRPGDYSTAPGTGWFRGNFQRIYVLKRRNVTLPETAQVQPVQPPPAAARRSAGPSPSPARSEGLPAPPP